MSVKKSVNVLEKAGAPPYNCFLRNGGLIPGFLIGNVGKNKIYDINFAAYSKLTNMCFAYSGDERYISSDGTNFTFFMEHNGNNTFFVEDVCDGAARAILISGHEALVYYNKNRQSFITFGKSFDCGVIHCGRLFAAKGIKIYWSGTGGFDDWSEGIGGSGEVMLSDNRGSVLNMLEFGGKVVAVRENGLTLLNMYGSPENFSVEITDTYCEKIYRDSAQDYGKNLYF